MRVGESAGQERESNLVSKESELANRESKLKEQVCMKIFIEHARTLGTWPHYRLPCGMILALHMTRTIMCIN